MAQTADTPSPSVDPGQRSNRSALMIVFLVVFIDLLGFGIVLPMLPRIAKSYLSHIIAETEPTTIGAVTGLLMSSFSLMQFLFAPAWGRLSDRIGRRPVLLVGLFGSVVFYTLFGFAASEPSDYHTAIIAVTLFFVARIGAGISGATISTAQAVIADSTPPDKRKHGMALIGAAFGIGFTFGPLIGFGCVSLSEAMPSIGLGSIGYSAAILSFIALLLALRLLPETRVAGAESTVRRNLIDASGIRFALANPALGPIILIFFLSSLGFGAFEVTLSVFLQDIFSLNEQYSFLFFAYVGFVLMLTQGFLYRRLASRVSEVTFIAMGICFMAVGVGLQGAICYAVAKQVYDAEALKPVLVIALTAAVVGFAFLTPSAQALVSRRTPSDRQGEILGVNQSASALARILGPLFGMILYQAHPTHILPYIAGAVLLVLMLPLLPRIRRMDSER
jgi:MFS family permease